MPRLKLNTFEDIAHAFADPAVLSAASLGDRLEFDLIVFAAGFEPRCLSVPEKLSTLGVKAQEICIVRYETNTADNGVYFGALETLSREMTETVSILTLEAPDFSIELTAWLSRLSNDKIARVLFDISAASNRLVLTALSVMFDLPIHLDVTYAEASAYAPSQDEYEADKERWASEGLTHGVGDITVGLSYAGDQIDPLPDCLVIIPGYGRDRAQAVINWVVPGLPLGASEQVIWLIGRPHLPNDAWRAQALLEIHDLADVPQRFELDTFNYSATLERLEWLYQRWGRDHQLSLAPMGSKLQALGAAVFCRLRPDVRLVFATPERYEAAGYSTGCREMWHVNLGSIPQLCRILGSVDTVEVVDDDAP